MRKRIAETLKEAEKANDSENIALLRLITAAIIDRDNVARGSGNSDGIANHVIIAMLNKMIQQRKSSAVHYDEVGHVDLASRERREINKIEELLPRKLTNDEIERAVSKVIKEIGAKGIRDKGRVMEALKAKYRDRMDFRLAGNLVVERLC